MIESGGPIFLRHEVKYCEGVRGKASSWEGLWRRQDGCRLCQRELCEAGYALSIVIQTRSGKACCDLKHSSF